MTKLWGSRFKKTTDSLADKFTFSISYDKRLAKYDVLGSIAHATMLGKCKIINKSESAALVKGLQQILKQLEAGKFKFDPAAEDIHTNIQSALKEIAGKVADKLHTARSRNDQIVLDVKLYCRAEIDCTVMLIEGLQKSILYFAEKNKDVLMPAYTHLQAAQVILLAHHMLAYIEMFERDKARLLDTRQRVNTMPLGSCALSGTSLPIDRTFVAKELGFDTPTANSIDSVSDRDFIVEIISDLSILAMHFGRMAEDLILWATKEFNFIDIDWSFCTGSSIMPHKKNPDVLELIRGETAKLYGHLNTILVLLKGLPLTYNRDLQLDKPPLFESFDKIQDMLLLITKLFENLTVKENVLKNRTKDESFFTVDVMEYLIKRGVAYRDAHDLVGRMVKECLDQGERIAELSLDELKKYSPHFELDVKKLLNPEMSVKIKQSLGSTSPQLVAKQLQSWKKKLYA